MECTRATPFSVYTSGDEIQTNLVIIASDRLPCRRHCAHRTRTTSQDNAQPELRNSEPFKLESCSFHTCAYRQSSWSSQYNTSHHRLSPFGPTLFTLWPSSSAPHSTPTPPTACLPRRLRTWTYTCRTYPRRGDAPTFLFSSCTIALFRSN